MLFDVLIDGLPLEILSKNIDDCHEEMWDYVIDGTFPNGMPYKVVQVAGVNYDIIAFIGEYETDVEPWEFEWGLKEEHKLTAADLGLKTGMLRW